jgi:hypothetical protein
MASADDVGSDTEQLFRDVALSMRKKEPHLESRGYCHNCHEGSGSSAFCSAECREDYEMRRRMGVR